MVLRVKTLHILLTLIFGVSIKFCCGYIYPGNSAYGLFAAIAVPLNLPHQNVFVSYNFEANYNLPGDAKTIIPGPYQRFTPIEEMSLGEVNTNNPEEETPVIEEIAREETKAINDFSTSDGRNSRKMSKNSKQLITKRTAYRILQDQLKVSGFEGEPCLLKLICEINSSLLGKHNGVFGSILHILLTPSTTCCEKLPAKMYLAEENGVKGDCFQYNRKCTHNVMDLLSVPIEDFLHNKLRTA